MSLPETIETELDRSQQLFLEGDYASCSNMLEKLVQDHPEVIELRLTLGRAQFEQALIKKAKTHLQVYVDHFPDHALANKLLAKSYMHLDELETAKPIIDMLLKKYPEDRVVCNLKDMLARKGKGTDLDGLDDDTVKTVRPSPTSTIAKLYEEQGHVDQANKIYQALLDQKGEKLIESDDKLSTLSLDDIKQDSKPVEYGMQGLPEVHITDRRPLSEDGVYKSKISNLNQLLSRIGGRKK